MTGESEKQTVTIKYSQAEIDAKLQGLESMLKNTTMSEQDRENQLQRYRNRLIADAVPPQT